MTPSLCTVTYNKCLKKHCKNKASQFYAFNIIVPKVNILYKYTTLNEALTSEQQLINVKWTIDIKR